MFCNVNKKTAQSSIELTIALIIAMVLLIGAARIFSMMNSRMVTRQLGYEVERAMPGR